MKRYELHRHDHLGWLASERKEYTAHRKNESWQFMDFEDVPVGRRRLVKLVWVYKVKRDGTLKSRLCVQGCTQRAGIDYHQTFCSTMRPTSLRLIAAIAAGKGLRLRRLDFVSAYLQGQLEEGEYCYCSLPAGFAEITDEREFGRDGKRRVCCVTKPIYGMAQAGRRWQRSLFPWLKAWGCTQCSADDCVFSITREMSTPNGPRMESLLIGVYVDDLAVAYEFDDDHSLYQSFFVDISTRWNIEDEGEISDLLGVEFDYGSSSPTSIKLHQKGYIDRMLETFLPDGIPATFQQNKTPSTDDLAQIVADALVLDPPKNNEELVTNYRRLVGSLLYAATYTRPDIAYSVNMLCRVMVRPTPACMEAALRVLRYLGRTKSIGLTFAFSPTEMFGMSDSDWATRHSTSGWLFLFHQAAVCWSSRKQKSVALSSTEAEIMAASEAAKEAVHLTEFISELDSPLKKPMALYVDNKGAIDLAYNSEHHDRSKHIARRHFFVRELVEDSRLRVPYVRTADNLADFFTKHLVPKVFYPMRDVIMNITAPEHKYGGERKPSPIS